MKRLLLVSYFYPPLAGPGVFRPLRLSKYLPRHGWSVTVLTVSERVRLLKDPALEGEVPREVRVERTRSLEPRDGLLLLGKLGLGGLARRLEPWFLLPDDQRGWVGPATRRGLRLANARKYDVLLSTAGPYSAHLVGRALHRRTGTPWIADFRDEWTTNPYLRDRYPTAWHLRRNQALERSVVREADRVVCVSRPWLDAIRAIAPESPEAKFLVMPNGYDAEHFPEAPPPLPDRFRVIYTGMFYGHRSPRPFLEALHEVLRSGRIPAGKLEIIFMGHTAEGGSLTSAVDDAVSSRLRIVPQRPYREALDLLHRAAVLLLVIPPEGGTGNHTGKLFPYLASGRPILALAPEHNVAADLIRATRSGVVVPPDDPHSIAEGLELLYRRWEDGTGLPDQDREHIRRYEADPQAREWAVLLDSLSGGEAAGARR